MANTFINVSDVAMEAAATLNDRLVAANLVNRSHEARFANKVGDNIQVKTPADLGDANEFTSTTSATDITETSRVLTLEKHFYQLLSLSATQLTLNVEDFMVQVMDPALKSIAESVDGHFVNKISSGFGTYLTGTAGTAPSTVEDIVLARKTILDNRGNTDNLVGLIGTSAEASFLQLNQFTSADFGVERPLSLREASIGKAYGIEYFTSQNVATADFGDTAGTVLLNGAATAGDTTINIDGLTASTGTIKAGTRFSIAGTATVYSVSYDATISSNAATLTIQPPLTANEADNDAISFATENTQDTIYNPVAVAGAVVGVQPMLGKDSAVETANGISVRVTFDGSTSTLANQVLVDVLCGCQVIEEKHGTVFQA